MSSVWPELEPIREGYYAILDPAEPDTVSYWRRFVTKKRDGLHAWPAKSWYGPRIPLRRELPDDPRARQEFVAAWSQTRRDYLDRVVAAIAADVVAAGRRFADLSTRCCRCGRVLRDATSKTVAIGPECRSGLDPAVLAHYLTPQVGRAHAEQLSIEGGDQ